MTSWFGSFVKYQQLLEDCFAQQDVDGSCLDDVLKSDIHNWGIKKFKDKTNLYKHIQQLRSGLT